MNRMFRFCALLVCVFSLILPESANASPILPAATQAAAPAAAPAQDGLATVAFSPDGKRVASGGDDTRIFLWDTATGALQQTLPGHVGAAVTAVAFSPSGTILASAGRDSVVRLWDPASAAAIRNLAGSEEGLRTLAFSPDGATLAAGGEDTSIFLWDVATGKLRTILAAPGDFVNAIAFSPDGKILASGSQNGRITLWDVASGRQLKTLLGHSGDVTSLAFSPNGTTLASAGGDGTLRLWDVPSRTQRLVLRGNTKRIKTVAFSPDGLTLAGAGEDNRVTLWDPATGRPIRTLAGHAAAVTAVAFTRDGKTLASAGLDGQVILWNPATGGQLRAIKKPPRAAITAGAGTAGTTTAAAPTAAGSAAVSAATAAAPTTGPGGPILLITTAADPFSSYYAEILRNEGLNEFATADITTVSATTLAGYDVAILAQMPLAAAQVTMFTNWVNTGGNLIAMRPDKQLAGLLGLADANATLADAYLLVDTSKAPGNGITNQTIQFHGVADRYTLSGATGVSTLYANAATATANPAVTLRSVTGGGQAAAFTYDLARSVVYTRQGNPAWAGQERDGQTPIRSDDLYYGAATVNPAPDWVDLNKVQIPQADEQQRLLANLILYMNQTRKPLPRFWYFPRGLKAVVIMTGDDHGNGGTAGRFDQYIADSPAGCVVDNWECIRGTSYVYPGTPLTNAQAASYTSQGFEVGLHVTTSCLDFTPSSLDSNFTQQLSAWSAQYTSLPSPQTNRTHCIVWSDWPSEAKVSLAHGIRLDTNYYYWPGSWITDRPGLMTGSGMPMRFADLNGTMIDVYQAATQMTDESGQTYPYNIDTLLNNATGSLGYYGAFTVNAHNDTVSSSVADAVVASAQAHNVPVVTSLQMLKWIDGRNNSTFGALNWNGTALSFSITPGTGANNLQAMVPTHFANLALTGLTLNGGPAAYTAQGIKGVEYAFFSAAAGSYIATYAADTTPPTVTATNPANGATGVNTAASISASFSEPVDSSTVNASTVVLLDAANNQVSATVGYDASSRSAILKPTAPLTSGATYSMRLVGGATDPRIKDLAGNALAAPVTWSFTAAAAPPCPCSIWSSSATPGNPSQNDPNAVELGVKFQADVNGLITGIRFYKGTTNTGTHVGNLWSAAGQLLASATFAGESASGWQQVSFASPVAVTANTVYIASYHTNTGNYAGDSGYFATTGVDNPPLHALSDGVSGGDGVYAYGANSAFPNNTFQSTNYWVDVVFALPLPDTTPPTVTSTTPANGATGVPTGANVTATFSEAIDVATINGTTFQLTDPSNAVVPATVSYNGASNTATLTPSAPLTGTTTYTARLKGGASGIKDLAGNALVADYTWSFTTAVNPCASAANPIVAENCLAGNPASEWDISGAGDTSIQGFATDISVNRGGAVSFKINTNATAYTLNIYRLGYYGGMGARKVATVQPSASLPQTQPACLTDATTGLIDCGNWAVSASWAVPANATSGIYVAKVIRSDTGGASHIVFIVRDDASTSDLLFQTSDTTWQAYNNYGGNSLYAGGPGTNPARAYKVSYNRPFNTRAVDSGQDWLFNAEYPMVRWLEANGYDVSYATGVDSDRNGALIRNHKTFLSVGHDEYWSANQRTNVEAARTAGVNLAFFSGNEIFWKTRWENSIDGSGTAYRTLVSYKETHANAVIDPADPPTWTGTWRDPRFSPPADGGRPEYALSGNFFMVNDGATTAIVVSAADGQMRFWRNTSIATLAAGSTATLSANTLGYEWDEDLDSPARPAGVVRMSTTTVNNAPVLQDYGSTYASGTAIHHLTLYRAGSGALVFGAGTVQWSWGLDGNHDRGGSTVDARMQQATVNLLADMKVQPATLQTGLVAATASTDTAAPTSIITAPANNATVSPGTPLTISGTAADTGGGVVGGVEVSVDGGTTWHPANGRASWSYSWTPSAAGTVTIKSRSADDSGNLEAPSAGITVTVKDTIPPAAPTGLTATGSTAGIALAWNANTEPDLAGYNVYRAASSAGPFTKLNASLLTVTGYNDTAAPTGVTSYYRVTAVDTSGNESTPATASALRPDTTPPAAPTGLTATAAATGIALSWTANTEPDLAGYRVYRAASATGPFTQINAGALATPAYEDTLAPSGTSYYQVAAVDFSGNVSTPSAVASATMAKANRLQNPGFEIDANNDGLPDSWSTNSRFTRSNASARSGTYSGRHFATNNSGYTINQAITGLTAGASYTFAGWVNIPATTDAFSFSLQIRWRNASNGTISTSTVKTYSAATSGWNEATATLVAPTGTASAQVLMVVSSLNATIYVDDFAFR
jgi:WD40 repeat protein